MEKWSGIVKEHAVPVVWSILVVVAPFLYVYEGGASFHGAFVFALTACLSVAVVLLNTKLRFPKLTGTDMALLLFASYQGVQLLAAHSDAETVAGGLLWFFIYAMARILCLQAAYMGRIIVAAVILSAWIQSWVAALQWGGVLTSHHPLFAITGSFMNPGPLGGCLAVGIALGMGALIGSPLSRTKRLVAAFLLLWMSVVCLCSDSRSAWLACAAGGAVALFCFTSIKWAKVLLPLLWGIGTFGLYFYRSASADGRILIWKICGRMMGATPWTGHGVGTFQTEYMFWQGEYFGQAGATTEEMLLAADNVHPYNELLRILCEQGIIGGLLVFGAMVGCIVLYKKTDRVNRVALCGVAAWVSFSFFSYPCDVFPLQIILPLLLAVAVPPKEMQRHRLLPFKIVTVPLCLLFSLYIASGWYSLASVRSMLAEHYISDDIEIEETLNRKFTQFAGNGSCVALYARNLFEKGLYEEAIPVMRQSIALHPSGRKYLELGDACQYVGDTLSAMDCYRVASRMLPGHVLPVYHRFCLSREMGNPMQADSLARRLLSMPVKVENAVVREARRDAEKYLNLRKR